MAPHEGAGKPAPRSALVNVPRLVSAFYTLTPDVSKAAQRVSFGTSGHRGSSLKGSFNEGHILATSQAICEHRRAAGIDGPLFLGMDTHALSESALGTALVNTQRYDDAIEVLTRATQLPDYASAEGFFSLGQAYVNLKRYKEAVAPLEEATALAPDEAVIWATLGWAHFGLKDAESFKKTAGKARSLGYNEPTLLQYLGRVEGGEEIK